MSTPAMYMYIYILYSRVKKKNRDMARIQIKHRSLEFQSTAFTIELLEVVAIGTVGRSNTIYRLTGVA